VTVQPRVVGQVLLTRLPLGVARALREDADAATVINFIRSQPLGAIINSTPAVMDAPSVDPPPDELYPGFSAANINRRSIIWVGANDIIDGVDPKDFEKQLDNMLGRLEDTKAFIAIADIPDLTELPRFRENPTKTVTRKRIGAFNDAIKRQANDHGAALVRLSAEEVEDRFVSDADGFHPNDRGYRRIAELFLKVIEPEVAAIGRPRPAHFWLARG